MPSPFEPFDDNMAQREPTRSLRLLELEGPYFQESVAPLPWVKWFVETLGRVEIHNQPLIDRFVLRDDLITAMSRDRPNFTLSVCGHAWPPHLEQISPKLEQYGIMHQYRYEDIVEAHVSGVTDPVLRPAVYLVKKFLGVMNDLQLVVRD